MSEDDLDIWERVFERSFSAATTSIKPVNIIDDLAGKCSTGGPRYASRVFFVSIDVDLL
jgi:hypothetical protein